MMSKLYILKKIVPLIIIMIQTVNVSAQVWSTPVLAEEINGADSNIGAYSGLQIVNGNPALVYWDATHNNLMYRRSKDVLGNDWEPAIILDLTGDVGLTPSFEIVNGHPAVAYHDFSNGDLKYILAKDINGTEWYPPLVVDDHFEVGTYASMKVVNGNPSISYFDATNNDLKYCRALDNNGFTWSAPMSLDVQDYVGMFPSLQVVDGKPAIAYYDYVGNHNLKFIRSLDANGTVWAGPVVLDQTGDVGYYPSLQVIKGRPAVAYLDATNGDLKFIRSSDASGSSWPSPISIDVAGTTGLFPSLLTVDGFPAVTYYSRTNKNLNYIRATDSLGTAWSTPLVIDLDGDVGIRPCMRIIEGNPAVAYQDNANGTLKYMRAIDKAGQSWGGPVSLDENGVSGYDVNLLLVNGNPAIACFGNTDLRYMRATNASGSEWSKPVIVDSSAYVGRYASMKIVGGKPCISYFDATHGRFKYVSAADENGTVWNTPVTVNRPGSNGIEGYFTSLAEVKGNPAVVFTDTEIEKIVYMRADDPSGTSWSNYTYIAGEVLGIGHYKSLHVVNGNPAISCYSIHGELNYVRATDELGTSWEQPISIDPTTGSGMYSSLNTVNGNPAISYYDETNGNLKYIRATDPNGTTWNTPVTIESAGFVGKYTSLQIIDGNPAISYFDATTRYLKYVRALDPSGNSWASPVSVALIGDPDTAPSSGSFGMYISMIPMNDGAGIAYYNEIEQFPFFIGGIMCELPTSPSVSAGSTILCLGQSTTLKVNGALNDATRWQWYKDACGGLPVGEGDEITVTPETFTAYYVMGEGGCVPPGECKDVSVWVSEPPTKPTITLNDDNPEDIILATSGGTSYQWFNFGEPISGATDSIYHVTSEGSFSAAIFFGACSSELSDPYVFDIPTGIPSLKENIFFYPNPVKDYLLVSLESFQASDELEIQIQDVLGRTMKKLKGSGKTILEVDVRNYPQGNYLLWINHPSQNNVIKFIKLN
ncbi:MAG: T9SS type A sorting domain-containing protein [Chryseolinea sp.]